MKKTTQLISLAMAGMMLISTSTFAYGVKDKAVEKATAAVENAAPDDWKTLASQADFLIRKDAGLSSAKQWLEKSLEIKEDTYNLEVMGDYYMSSNLPAKAIAYYVKSIDKKREGNQTADTREIQEKVMAARAKM